MLWRDTFPKGKFSPARGELFLAIGILGATIMPHNLFLHSSLIQSQRLPSNRIGKEVRGQVWRHRQHSVVEFLRL
jgi:manganese transport protein